MSTLKGLRVSQRAPKACLPCSKRRVKCDKRIPCQRCIKRGEKDKCKREALIVKGRVVNARSLNLAESDVETYNISARFLSYGYANNGDKNMEAQLDFDWDSFYSNFSRLLTDIDYQKSRVLIEFACVQLTFIHNGIIPSVFLEEHEKFWEDVVSGAISLNMFNKPVGSKYYTRNYFYWIGKYYALLCCGLYFGDSYLNEQVDLSKEHFTHFPKLLFRASLRCLENANFMANPDIRCIQIFCIMSTCFHGFAGVHLHNSLLTCMFYIARFLSLDRLENETGKPDLQTQLHKRIWWTLFIIEALSDGGRWAPLKANSPGTYPRLLTVRELTGVDLYIDAQTSVWTRSQGYSYVLYEMFMAKMATIKREHYPENGSTPKLESLQQADRKMGELLAEYYKTFCSLKVVPQPDDIDSITYPFAKYLLNFSINYEALEITRQFLTLVGREKWMSIYRSRCISHSMAILKEFNKAGVPKFYNRIWTVSQQVIRADLFILLDAIMTGEKISYDDYRIVEVRHSLAAVAELKQSHTTVKVGTAILEKLLQIVSYLNFNDNSLEETSIFKFLDELRLQHLSPSQPQNSKSGLFLADKNDVIGQPLSMGMTDLDTSNKLKDHDFNFPDILNDSGWDSLLHWVSNGYFNLD